MYTDPTGNTPIREVFGEINGTVNWHQSKSSKSASYATVKLNGLSFNFIIDKNDNIILETADGLVVNEKSEPITFGRFTFNYRNPNSKSKCMDIDEAKTLGTMGLYAVANDEDNPVTAFAVVHPEFLKPLSPLNGAEIELRKDFYNALVETGFDANSYDGKMIKSVFDSMKEKNDYVKDDFGIRTMLKTQQNFAMNISSWDMYVASLQYDLTRLSVLQGAIGGMATNAMGNSFMYPKYSSYSMKVNGKECFPKNGSVTAFKGTGNTGVLDNANFAQKTYSSTFSKDGIEIYSKLAGKPINTIDDLASALKNGTIKASDVPIDYIVRDGNTLMLNTRSSQALTQAGIPRSQWNAVNQTGNSLFEDMLTGQLSRNGLTSSGTSTVRLSGGTKG